MVFVLKLAQFFRSKWSFEAEIIPLLSFCYDIMTRMSRPVSSDKWKALLNNRQNFLLYSKNFESYEKP